MNEKKDGTRFSRFAQILFLNQPPNERIGKICEFTLFLLKAGLDVDGAKYIEERYSNYKARLVEPGKEDPGETKKEYERLRDYFKGRSNITNEAPMIIHNYHRKYFQTAMQPYKKSFTVIREQLEKVGETFTSNQIAVELAKIFGDILDEAANARFLRNQSRLKSRLKKVPEDSRNDIEQMKRLPKESIKDNNLAETVENIERKAALQRLQVLRARFTPNILIGKDGKPARVSCIKIDKSQDPFL